MATKRPIGRSDYSPSEARIGGPSPQTAPELFSVEDLRAEIKYLQSANRRYGVHPLRTLAILKLEREMGS